MVAALMSLCVLPSRFARVNRRARKYLNGYMNSCPRSLFCWHRESCGSTQGLPKRSSAAALVSCLLPSRFARVNRPARQCLNGYMNDCLWLLCCGRRVCLRKYPTVTQRLCKRSPAAALLPSCFPVVNRCARQLARDHQHPGGGGGAGRTTSRGPGGTSDRWITI